MSVENSPRPKLWYTVGSLTFTTVAMLTIQAPDFSSLMLDVRSGVVRSTALFEGANLPLRVMWYDDRALLMTRPLPVGPAGPLFHDARAIVDGLLTGADDFQLPLPEPVLVRELILDDLTFTETEIAFLTAYTGGQPQDYLRTTYGAAFSRETVEKASRIGIKIQSATGIGSFLADAQDAKARLTRELAAQAMLTEESDRPAPALIAPAQATPAVYGVITKASPAEFERAQRRAGGLQVSANRITWPFKTMEIGDQVRVDPKQRVKAQTAVHVYGARSGKRFTTETVLSDGSLRVVRIADKERF